MLVGAPQTSDGDVRGPESEFMRNLQLTLMSSNKNRDFMIARTRSERRCDMQRAGTADSIQAQINNFTIYFCFICREFSHWCVFSLAPQLRLQFLSDSGPVPALGSAPRDGRLHVLAFFDN